jgi:hypothetical protein
MEALAAGHDAAVQMIGTSVVRVHQHGACIARAQLIERFFNKIKQCRRVATRYDKLAANYLACVKLASIRIWLRANEPSQLVRRRLATISTARGYRSRRSPGRHAVSSAGEP